MKFNQDEKPSPDSHRSNHTLYFIIFLMIVGCLSRFFWLGRESLWLDEAASLNISNQIRFLRLDGLFFSKWSNPHPFFYYFLLYGWTKCFGTSELALRSLSAILGVLLIVSTYSIGCRTISKRVGAIASVFLLINPVALYYAQEARMYTLIPLLILFSTFYFYRLLTKPDMKNMTLYILLSVVLIYTDYLGALLLLTHVSFSLWTFFQTREKRIYQTLILAEMMVFFLYIPWLPNAFLNLNWEMISWMEPPNVLEGVTVALKLLGVQLLHVKSLHEGLNLTEDLTFTHLILIVFHFFFYVWAIFIPIVGLIVSLKEKTSFKTLLAMLCLVPLIIFLISISFVPIFNLRQASVYLPALGLTLASGLVALTSFIQRRFKIFTTASVNLCLLMPLFILNLVGTYLVYTVDTKEDWRQMAKDMEATGGKPIMICREYMTEPFLYYYRGSARVIGVQKQDLSRLSFLAGSKEFILIVSHVNSEEILPAIKSTFQIKKVYHYRGAEIYFLEKKSKFYISESSWSPIPWRVFLCPIYW